jgi:hypothetical protein
LQACSHDEWRWRESERERERVSIAAGRAAVCRLQSACQTKPNPLPLVVPAALCSAAGGCTCTLKQRAFLPLFPTTPGHTAHTIHLLHFLPGLWATYYPSVSVTSPPPPPPPPPPRLRPSLAMSGLYSQGFSPARNLSPQIRSNPDADRYGRGAAPRRAHVFL